MLFPSFHLAYQCNTSVENHSYVNVLMYESFPFETHQDLVMYASFVRSKCRIKSDLGIIAKGKMGPDTF